MAITDDPSELTHDDIPELLKNDVSIKVGGTDVDGIIRGKLMSKRKFLSIVKSGFGFCSVIFGWDMHDQTYFKELKISNAANGYRDINAVIDLSSFRRIPWENDIPFFLCSFREPEGESLSACPRSLLERQVEKIEAKGFGALAGGMSALYCHVCDWLAIIACSLMALRASRLTVCVLNKPSSNSTPSERRKHSSPQQATTSVTRVPLPPS